MHMMPRGHIETDPSTSSYFFTLSLEYMKIPKSKSMHIMPRCILKLIHLLPLSILKLTHLHLVISSHLRGGSICNENPFITPSTNALGFYAICQTKDQSVAVIMVHKHYFIFQKLISYRLFKEHTYIHFIYFPPN